MTVTIDVGHILTVFTAAVGVTTFYWKNKNYTDTSLAKQDTTLNSMKKDIEWIDEARAKFSSLETTLVNLSKLFDDLKPLLTSQAGLEMRLQQIESELKGVHNQLDELSKSIENIKYDQQRRGDCT